MHTMKIFQLELTLLFALTASTGCLKKSTSDLKIFSNHSVVYDAAVHGIKIEYNLNDYLEYLSTSDRNEKKLTLEALKAAYANESMRTELDMMMINDQLQFLIGAFKGERSSFTRHKIEVKSTSRKTIARSNAGNDVITSIVYDVSFLLTRPRDRNNQLTIYLPINIDISSRKNQVIKYPDCFDQQLIQLIMNVDPVNWPESIFYYFKGVDNKCQLAGSGEWQGVALEANPSQFQTTDKRYPEINRIWEDNQFIATIIFTPTTSFGDKDAGIYAYSEMAQKLVQKYGKPLEGPLPAPLVGSYGVAQPTQVPNITLSFRGNAGRIMVFHLMAWNDNWQESEETKVQFGRFSRESDFISYNGHAHYGVNVKLMEEWSQVDKGHYQVFYWDGCSTFAYTSQKMDRKVEMINPGERASKYLDVISNISPAYFGYMPLQNLALIDGMITGDKSYSEIFATIEATIAPEYSPWIIVSGEEDNAYKP